MRLWAGLMLVVQPGLVVSSEGWCGGGGSAQTLQTIQTLLHGEIWSHSCYMIQFQGHHRAHLRSYLLSRILLTFRNITLCDHFRKNENNTKRNAQSQGKNMPGLSDLKKNQLRQKGDGSQSLGLAILHFCSPLIIFKVNTQYLLT